MPARGHLSRDTGTRPSLFCPFHGELLDPPTGGGPRRELQRCPGPEGIAWRVLSILGCLECGSGGHVHLGAPDHMTIEGGFANGATGPATCGMCGTRGTYWWVAAVGTPPLLTLTILRHAASVDVPIGSVEPLQAGRSGCQLCSPLGSVAHGLSA